MEETDSAKHERWSGDLVPWAPRMTTARRRCRLLVHVLINATVALVVDMAKIASQLVDRSLKGRLVSVVGKVGQPPLLRRLVANDLRQLLYPIQVVLVTPSRRSFLHLVDGTGGTAGNVPVLPVRLASGKRA
jgi:hypothetical protein